MALLLSDVAVNAQDHLYGFVIDEFRKSSFLLDNLPFDNAVSPTGGGTTMTYAYNRVTTQATAATRAINSEYTTQEAKKQRFNVDLKVFGGAFAIDRVLANMGGITDEVQFQMQQKIKAVQALFSDMVINGDTGSDVNGFDGLSKALVDTDNALTTTIDVSSAANVTSNYMALLDEIDALDGALDGAPSALLMNAKTKAKFMAVARRASMYQETRNTLGQKIDNYGSTPIVDLGAKSGTNDPIIANGEIYAVRFGLDGFHAVTVSGNEPIKYWLPDFETAGAVKKGEVEMLAAVALKSTKAAAKLSGIVVA